MTKTGKRLKQLREKRGLKQTQLADIMNVSNRTISVYEKGTVVPPTENLERLATFFDVTTDYLLGRTNNPKVSLNERGEEESTKINVEEMLDKAWLLKGNKVSEELKREVLGFIEFRMQQKKIKNE